MQKKNIYYFVYKKHCLRTRNQGVLLIDPKIKIEIARSSFFIMGVKVFNPLPIKPKLSFVRKWTDFLGRVSLIYQINQCLFELNFTFLTRFT